MNRPFELAVETKIFVSLKYVPFPLWFVTHSVIALVFIDESTDYVILSVSSCTIIADWCKIYLTDLLFNFLDVLLSPKNVLLNSNSAPFAPKRTDI